MKTEEIRKRKEEGLYKNVSERKERRWKVNSYEMK